LSAPIGSSFAVVMGNALVIAATYASIASATVFADAASRSCSGLSASNPFCQSATPGPRSIAGSPFPTIARFSSAACDGAFTRARATSSIIGTCASLVASAFTRSCFGA